MKHIEFFPQKLGCARAHRAHVSNLTARESGARARSLYAAQQTLIGVKLARCRISVTLLRVGGGGNEHVLNPDAAASATPPAAAPGA